MSDSLNASEAAQFLGISVRTLKRMCDAGDLASFRTPGGHIRVRREDAEAFASGAARPGAAAGQGAGPSPVLRNRREHVEELTLEAQELRAQREIKKLNAEDREAEEERKAQLQIATLAAEKEVERIRLQADREAEARRRAHAEANDKAKLEAFRREWTRYAERKLFFPWLTVPQLEVVQAAVESVLARCGPDDAKEMPRILEDLVARVCAPWLAELENAKVRDRLVEEGLAKVTWKFACTAEDRARVAATVREAVSRAPIAATLAELKAVAQAAITPILATVDQRQKKTEHVSAGVARVQTYLLELYISHEIDLSTFTDFEWQKDLCRRVGVVLEEELTGGDDESREDAERIVEDFVDDELS